MCRVWLNLVLKQELKMGKIYDNDDDNENLSFWLSLAQNLFSLFKVLIGPYSSNLEFPISKFFRPNLLKIAPVVLEKNILKFCHCIFAILQLSPMECGGAF